MAIYASLFFLFCEIPGRILRLSFSLKLCLCRLSLVTSPLSPLTFSLWAFPNYSSKLRDGILAVSVTAAVKETGFSVMMTVIKGSIGSFFVPLKQELTLLVSLLQCYHLFCYDEGTALISFTFSKSWYKNSCLTRKKGVRNLTVSVIIKFFFPTDFFLIKYFLKSHKVKVKVAQLCPTLCDSMDYTVHGILQARVLEWRAFPSSHKCVSKTAHCLKLSIWLHKAFVLFLFCFLESLFSVIAPTIGDRELLHHPISMITHC